MDGTHYDDISGNAQCGGTGFAGHTDWRIPNVQELQSIVDYEVFDPSVDPAFHQSATCTGCADVTLASCSCTEWASYWSSTSYAPQPNFAVLVRFDDGMVSNADKGSSTKVRAVRGGSFLGDGCEDPPLQGASIVIFEQLSLSVTEDVTLTLKNKTNSLQNARCFYAGRPSCGTPLVQFDVELILQETRTWQAKVGDGGEIPAAPVPFDGELVCVSVDVTDVPFGSNALTGTSKLSGACPVAEIGLLGNFVDFGNDLDLGIEYDACPATIPDAHIEGCWSNSVFNFFCN